MILKTKKVKGRNILKSKLTENIKQYCYGKIFGLTIFASVTGIVIGWQNSALADCVGGTWCASSEGFSEVDALGSAIGYKLVSAWNPKESGFSRAEAGDPRNNAFISYVPIVTGVGGGFVTLNLNFLYIGNLGLISPNCVAPACSEIISIGNAFGAGPPSLQVAQTPFNLLIDDTFTAEVESTAIANGLSLSELVIDGPNLGSASAEIDPPVEVQKDGTSCGDKCPKAVVTWDITSLHEIIVNGELFEEFETNFARNEEGEITTSEGLTFMGGNPDGSFEVAGSFEFIIPSDFFPDGEITEVFITNDIEGYLQTVIPPVPEPSTILGLLTIGGIALGASKKKQS